MKNIHIIPTDQPSKFGKIHEANQLHLYTDGEDPHNTCDNLAASQHLYITSQEEIKQDEPYLGEDNNIYYLCEGGVNFNGKKIILTTDQELIKDGVQGIDDTFLEWYINNPDCEFVEYDKNYNRANGKYHYKIIIPQEKTEHKGTALTSEEVMKERSSAYEFIDFAKEETDFDYNTGYYDGIKVGIQWQKDRIEKLYTEEEVLEIVRKSRYAEFGIDALTKWFEHFKK